MELSDSVEKAYLNVEEVSRYLGVKPSTIYQWAEEGKIPAYKVGRMWRFKKEEIDGWMESNRGNGTEGDKRAKRVLETAKSQKVDVDGIVRKAIEAVNRSSYNGDDGNQTNVKGLRKEVKNGNL